MHPIHIIRLDNEMGGEHRLDPVHLLVDGGDDLPCHIDEYLRREMHDLERRCEYDGDEVTEERVFDAARRLLYRFGYTTFRITPLEVSY
jgi:hypothetical protein